MANKTKNKSCQWHFTFGGYFVVTTDGSLNRCTCYNYESDAVMY